MPPSESNSSSSTGRPKTANKKADSVAKIPTTTKIESSEGKLPDLAIRSDQFRNEVLVPSGGWLADLIPTLSSIAGLYDIFLLAVVFVIAWVVLRTSDGVIALNLGRVFDLTIPLQYYLNPTLFPHQEPFLDAYWPLFILATVIEFACFLLVHHELFTLVTCLKTTLLTAAWMAKKDGVRVISKVTGRIPSPFSQSDPSRGTNRPSTVDPTKWRPTSADLKDWDKRLQKAGYSPKAVRDKMLEQLAKAPDKAAAEKKLKEWEALDPEGKIKVMEKNAPATVDPLTGQPTTPGTGGGVGSSDPRAREADHSSQVLGPDGRVMETRDIRKHEQGGHGLRGNVYDERLRKEMKPAHPYFG